MPASGVLPNGAASTGLHFNSSAVRRNMDRRGNLSILLCVVMMLLLFLQFASCRPGFVQRECLGDCLACYSCANELPHTEGCAVQCLLCDMCNACLHREECLWETLPDTPVPPSTPSPTSAPTSAPTPAPAHNSTSSSTPASTQTPVSS